ncbi:MAG TPA: hypothetical protein VIZ68_08170, partial [Thermoplasmata archaeon]
GDTRGKVGPVRDNATAGVFAHDAPAVSAGNATFGPIVVLTPRGRSEPERVPLELPAEQS